MKYITKAVLLNHLRQNARKNMPKLPAGYQTSLQQRCSRCHDYLPLVEAKLILQRIEEEAKDISESCAKVSKNHFKFERPLFKIDVEMYTMRWIH